MKRGFTLIELLVVIAIIGLLASIVLASVNTARKKGNDAAIKEQMVALRSQAALYYDFNNSICDHCYGNYTYMPHNCIDYGGDPMLTDTNVGNIVTKLLTLTSDPNQVLCTIWDSPTPGYLFSFPLKSQDDTSWCIDSFGYNGMVEATALWNEVSYNYENQPVNCTTY